MAARPRSPPTELWKRPRAGEHSLGERRGSEDYAVIPLSYFYLVNVETNEPLAIFSADDCHSSNDLAALEGRLRLEHNVDDATNGLALRNSVSARLPTDQIMVLLARQAHRRMRKS